MENSTPKFTIHAFFPSGNRYVDECLMKVGYGLSYDLAEKILKESDPDYPIKKHIHTINQLENCIKKLIVNGYSVHPGQVLNFSFMDIRMKVERCETVFYGDSDDTILFRFLLQSTN